MAKLIIEHVPISDLKEWGDNPRYHNVDAIRRSMERFGIRWPIIVNRRTMQVEAGHGRLKALRELGETEVPVLFVEDDDLTAKAFAIADNRTQELTQWDEAGLADVLTELEAGGELEPTAFSIDDLNELLRKLGRFEGETFDVEAAMAAAPDQVANTKRGDVWQLGRHRLMCGDSTRAQDVEYLMEGTRAFLMTTDPPYGVRTDHSWRDGVLNQRPTRRGGMLVGDDRCDWKDVYPLFDCHVLYVWHSALFSDVVKAGLEDSGYRVRQQIIWKKETFSFSRGAYHWRHEPCWYAVKNGATARWRGGAKQTTVWEAPSPIVGTSPNVEATPHPTQKPVLIFARPIRNHLDVGEVVVDPFLGSGTTIIAAEQTGRICYGMEIVPYYCDVAIARWEAFTGGQAVLVEEREMAYA